MPAMLRRTSASCRAGSVSRSARSANAIASLAVAGDVQRDRRRADDLAALGMVGRCDLERALSELRGGIGVGRDQRLRGVEQRRNRHLVTGLGAGGELPGDFDRQGAGFEQDAGRLAVERAAGGHRHACADGLAGDVVPEGQPLVALDEQVRLEQLPDRREESGRRPPERARQLVEGERAAERGGDGHSVACLVGEPPEPLAHLLLHAPGKLAIDQLGAAVDHAYPLLLLQPEERLDNEERAAVGLRQLLEDRLIGLGGEHVRGQLRDRVVIEWSEGDRAPALLLQLFERVHERRRFARRAKRDHPA